MQALTTYERSALEWKLHHEQGEAEWHAGRVTWWNSRVQRWKDIAVTYNESTLSEQANCRRNAQSHRAHLQWSNQRIAQYKLALSK